jgi:hypothetical protein
MTTPPTIAAPRTRRDLLGRTKFLPDTFHPEQKVGRPCTLCLKFRIVILDTCPDFRDSARAGRSSLVSLAVTVLAALASGKSRELWRMRCPIGTWAAIFGASAIAALASAAGTTNGDTPIPDSRFPSYVKFAGDKGNQGYFSNQARVDAVPDSSKGSIFFAGFFRPEDFPTFGMLVSFGNDGYRGAGLIGLSLGGYDIAAFEWHDIFGQGYGWKDLGRAPGIWPAGAKYVLGQWSHIALILNGPTSRQIIMDGVPGTDTGISAPVPVGANGFPLSLTFGSYYNTAPPGNGGDAHNFNGGLRDWVAGVGVPTPAELERMRKGEDPVAIWGAVRVWGYWHFTANPRLGQKERDVTGHGHDLTYIDAGSQAGHTLPILVTPGAPDRPTPDGSR